MKLSAFATALVLAWASTISGSPTGSIEARQVVSPPPGFAITKQTVNGSGCPPGSTFYVLNGDKSAVTVGFSRYYAEVGPNIPISSNRRNCQLTWSVNVPPGFSFGLAAVDYRGWYQLDDKVTASQQSSYYFQGHLAQATARSELVGPVAGRDYLYQDQFDLVSTVLSPCGTSTVLNIQTDLRTNNSKNPRGYGYIATDSINATLTQTFHFKWQTCKN
ncbi:hypothetical protein CC2G_001346 [Coprinopsis cinerea AmutBmut pab1-1]|nr:hypothetical protein CC2G_001346 [Coprinopsis cinerea AmutBmut pab1-1]